MATTAPVKPAAKRVSEPTHYNFQMIKSYEKVNDFDLPFPNFYQVKTQDSILWAYRIEEVQGVQKEIPVTFDEDFNKNEVVYKPRVVRYISGYNTIFKDEQENGQAWPPNDARIANRLNYDKLQFNRGTLRVSAFDKPLRNYLWVLNQCEVQHPAAKRYNQNAEVTYRLLDFGFEDQKKIDLAEVKQKAYNCATGAKKDILMPHAKFLGIPIKHSSTGEERSFDAIRADYIDYALANPYKFRESFNDPKMKLIEQIKEVVERQDITLGGKTPGQAHWITSGELISDYPLDVDPIPFLAEFAMTKAGEQFAANLKMLQ